LPEAVRPRATAAPARRRRGRHRGRGASAWSSPDVRTSASSLSNASAPP